MRVVECSLRRLDVRGYQRGHPLEPVGREGAAECEPAVDAHPRVPLPLPPHEALRPQVRLLHGAEAERGLS
eukprot:7389889-Prymnesium_polylepis.1